MIIDDMECLSFDIVPDKEMIMDGFHHILRNIDFKDKAGNPNYSYYFMLEKTKLKNNTVRYTYELWSVYNWDSEQDGILLDSKVVTLNGVEKIKSYKSANYSMKQDILDIFGGEYMSCRDSERDMNEVPDWHHKHAPLSNLPKTIINMTHDVCDGFAEYGVSRIDFIIHLSAIPKIIELIKQEDLDPESKYHIDDISAILLEHNISLTSLVRFELFPDLCTLMLYNNGGDFDAELEFKSLTKLIVTTSFEEISKHLFSPEGLEDLADINKRTETPVLMIIYRDGLVSLKTSAFHDNGTDTIFNFPYPLLNKKFIGEISHDH